MKNITEVTIEEIEQVYSGRTGCACGCRGTYSEKKSTIARTLNRFKKEAMSVEVNEPNIYAIDNGVRLNMVYLKEK